MSPTRLIDVTQHALGLAPTTGIGRSNRSTAQRLQSAMRRARHANVCSVPQFAKTTTVEDEAARCAAILHPETPATRPDSSQIPPGCVVGIPVPMGTPVSTTENDDRIRDVAILRSIQADNYRFIRHMITTGWEPRNPDSCSFVITMMESGLKVSWSVTEATPLHYAICCGKLESAAALLIAFPEHAHMRCRMQAEGDHRATFWTAEDLTVLFAGIFGVKNPEKAEAFTQARRALLQLRQDPSAIPFMCFFTPVDRLMAAGESSTRAMAVLVNPPTPIAMSQ